MNPLIKNANKVFVQMHGIVFDPNQYKMMRCVSRVLNIHGFQTSIKGLGCYGGMPLEKQISLIFKDTGIKLKNSERTFKHMEHQVNSRFYCAFESGNVLFNHYAIDILNKLALEKKVVCFSSIHPTLLEKFRIAPQLRHFFPMVQRKEISSLKDDEIMITNNIYDYLSVEEKDRERIIIDFEDSPFVYIPRIDWDLRPAEEMQRMFDKVEDYFEKEGCKNIISNLFEL